jgi:hypothetical protein
MASFGRFPLLAPKRKITRDKLGVTTVDDTHYVEESEVLAFLPQPQAKHPQFPRVYLTAAAANQDDCGIYIVSLKYEGFAGESDALPEPVWTYAPCEQQRPITANPRFKTEIAGTPEAPLTSVSNPIFESAIAPGVTGYSATADNATWRFKEFMPFLPDGTPNPFAGIKDWPAYTYLVTKQSVYFTAPGSMTAKDGYIDTPDWSGRPALPEDGNWLKGGTARWDRGNVIQFTEQWFGSGPGGFNEIIYTEP